MSLPLILVDCTPDSAREKADLFADLLVRLRQRREGGGAVQVVKERECPAALAEPNGGVILSGSPRLLSRGEGSDPLQAWLAGASGPLLGICYGHQLLAQAFGARVEVDERGEQRGLQAVMRLVDDELFAGLPWRLEMAGSHRETVRRDRRLTRHFTVLAVNDSGGVEAIRQRQRPLWGVQFHPERSAEIGERLLANFLAAAALDRSTR